MSERERERERFEKAICRACGFIDDPPYPRHKDGTYCDDEIEVAWLAWQARVPECEWKMDADGIWHTSCDNAWVFDAGDPADNKCKFCPYCGGSLIQAAPEPE